MSHSLVMSHESWAMGSDTHIRKTRNNGKRHNLHSLDNDLVAVNRTHGRSVDMIRSYSEAVIKELLEQFTLTLKLFFSVLLFFFVCVCVRYMFGKIDLQSGMI